MPASGISRRPSHLTDRPHFKPSAMDNILELVRRALRENANEKERLSGERFFREEIRLYGMKARMVIQIAKAYSQEITPLAKRELFALCDDLWESGYFEEAAIACEWAYTRRRSFEPDDFPVFEKWVTHNVSNWATCDTLCNHTIGTFMEMYPAYLAELKKWAHSGNRWVRRAAAVTLIVPARKGLFLPDIFEIARIMLTDPDDMVQKGYGWMLKVASQSGPATQTAVLDFVMENKKVMPRTALRYAIEKMPPDMKKMAMARP